MATEIHELPGARRTRKGADWKRTYVRSWRIKTDTKIGQLAARELCPVDVGNTYDDGDSTDEGSFVQDVEAADEGTGDGLSWIVTANYGPYDPTVNPASPLDRPLEIEWDYAAFEETVDVDIDGNAVVNSAADYFDPPITRDRARPILKVTRYESGFSASVTDQYADSVNDDVWMGAPARTVKLSPIKATLMRDQDIGWYWKRVYEFSYRAETWKSRPLDQGLRMLDGSTPPKRIPILVGGAITQSPVLLDGTGGVLATDGTPFYHDFKVCPERDFDALGFVEADFPGITW